MPAGAIALVWCASLARVPSKLAPGPAAPVRVVEMVWPSRELFAVACGERMCRVVEDEYASEGESLTALESTAQTCTAEVELPVGIGCEDPA